MAYDLDRRPGDFALRRGGKATRVAAVFTGIVVIAATLPLVLIALGAFGLVSAIGVLAIAGLAKVFADDRLDAALPWLKGGNAEVAIGEALEELRREQFVVMHDLDKVVWGNVDHLASGRTGVFMVETKFRSYRDADLGKAKRVAATIGNELGVWVTPIICLATRDYGPRRHQRVAIVGREQLLPFIRAQKNPTVAFERLARFADRQ